MKKLGTMLSVLVAVLMIGCAVVPYSQSSVDGTKAVKAKMVEVMELIASDPQHVPIADINLLRSAMDAQFAVERGRNVKNSNSETVEQWRLLCDDTRNGSLAKFLADCVATPIPKSPQHVRNLARIYGKIFDVILQTEGRKQLQ